ncbi:hypothetical protein WJX74_005513 [Apatococcus lobatus]|uniref:Uncharacterized protein n=1 Tax=Apatococcus lobatus TaxID=904363 RepID=A0AAW1SF12_9CHLO
MPAQPQELKAGVLSGTKNVLRTQGEWEQQHPAHEAPFGRTLDGPNTVAKEDQPAKPAGARQAGKQQRVQRVQTSQDAPCPNLRNLSTQGSGGSTSRRGFGFLRLSK